MTRVASRVLRKIKNLESLFRNGSDDEVVLQTVDTTVNKLLHYEEQKFGRDLEGIRRKVRRFEKKYKMDSTSFYRKFNDGRMGDSMDYMEWHALCDMQKRISDSMCILAERAMLGRGGKRMQKRH